MFGLSFGELLIICVVALLVLGPQGLPGLARTVGKAVRQFKNATGDLRSAMETEFYRMDEPPRPPVRPNPDGAIARTDPAAPALEAPAATGDAAASGPYGGAGPAVPGVDPAAPAPAVPGPAAAPAKAPVVVTPAALAAALASARAARAPDPLPPALAAAMHPAGAPAPAAPAPAPAAAGTAAPAPAPAPADAPVVVASAEPGERR